MHDAAIAAVLDRDCRSASAGISRSTAAAARMKRGRGVAIGMKASISPTTSVANRRDRRRRQRDVYCSTVDMGQGSTTAMAQIAAEVLGIEAEAVRVVGARHRCDALRHGDAWARARHFTWATRCACAAEEAKAKLAALAAETGVPEGSNLPIAELFRRKYGMQAGTVVGCGSFMPDYVPPDHATGLTPNATPYWMIGGSGAEVEVDTETGSCSRAASGQCRGCWHADKSRASSRHRLTGAAVMQLGFTLFEEMVFTDGQLRNPSLRRLQNSRYPRHAAQFLTGESVEARQAADPTVRRASAKPARSACRRRSPTRFTTRSACASRNCRSPPRRSTARGRPPAPAERRPGG